MADSNPNPQQKFKDKMKAQGMKELRGVYVKEERHEEIKKLIKIYEPNRESIILFLNSLPK